MIQIIHRGGNLESHLSLKHETLVIFQDRRDLAMCALLDLMLPG